METLADISDRFRFVEETLSYVDAPVEGFVVHVASAARYAFRSQEIVAEAVCHWVLLPVGDGQLTIKDVFASGRENPPSHWLSVIEDRREGMPRLELVMMKTETTRPPIRAD